MSRQVTTGQGRPTWPSLRSLENPSKGSTKVTVLPPWSHKMLALWLWHYAWWLIHLILVLRRLRQEDGHKFKATVSYTLSFRPV